MAFTGKFEEGVVVELAVLPVAALAVAVLLAVVVLPVVVAVAVVLAVLLAVLLPVILALLIATGMICDRSLVLYSFNSLRCCCNVVANCSAY